MRNSDLRSTQTNAGSIIDLRETNLSQANLYNSYLDGADMRGSDLSGADLSESYLPDVDFRGSNLKGVNLRGSDLRWAKLQEANLVGVRYDQRTQWPEGFNPDSEGAIFEK